MSLCIIVLTPAYPKYLVTGVQEWLTLAQIQLDNTLCVVFTIYKYHTYDDQEDE